MSTPKTKNQEWNKVPYICASPELHAELKNVDGSPSKQLRARGRRMRPGCPGNQLPSKDRPLRPTLSVARSQVAALRGEGGTRQVTCRAGVAGLCCLTQGPWSAECLAIPAKASRLASGSLSLCAAAMDLSLSRADYIQVNPLAGALPVDVGPLSAGLGKQRSLQARLLGVSQMLSVAWNVLSLPPGADQTSHIPGNHHNPVELTRSSQKLTIR